MRHDEVNPDQPLAGTQPQNMSAATPPFPFTTPRLGGDLAPECAREGRTHESLALYPCDEAG